MEQNFLRTPDAPIPDSSAPMEAEGKVPLPVEHIKETETEKDEKLLAIKEALADAYSNTELKETSAPSENQSEGRSQRKTIESPGVGNLEYVEETIYFSQDIVEKTGGVKGYIKKKIDWQNLGSLLVSSQDPAEVDSLNEALKRNGNSTNDEELQGKEKELMAEWLKESSLKPGSKMAEVYKALTDGDFPNDMMTHRLGFYGDTQDEKDFVKDKFLLQQISFSESQSEDGEKVKKYKPMTPIGSLRGQLFLLVDNETGKIEDTDIDSSYEQELRKGEILQEDGQYTIISPPGSGFSLSNKEDSYTYKPQGPTDMFFGFSQKNKAYMKYLEGMKNFYTELQPQLENLSQYDSRYKDYFDECVKNLEGTHTHMEGYRDNENWTHPKIPLVINNDKVPNLRWCHATYASIPTNKNLNIIEMIS